ncbi:S-adenosyl-L-methionine-dependent methyltransferase [Elaphomyces granulatus]
MAASETTTELKNIPRTAMYDSLYMAEAYDAFWETEKAPFHDAALFWDSLQKLRHERPPTALPEDRIVVLDVGTGTGRVLRNLVASAAKTNEDLTDTEFIGVDNSQQMLERAAQISQMSHVGAVSWVEGDARNLLDLEPFRINGVQVSLLTCAVGSFGYLEKDGDPEKFFTQVRQILRPESGRAYISLLEIQQAEAYQNGRTPSLYDDLNYSPKITDPTISFRPLSFREYTQDGMHVEEAETAVVRTDASGKEHILEVNHYSHKLHLWWEHDFLDVAQRAGLKHIETIKWPRVSHYVFKRPE